MSFVSNGSKITLLYDKLILYNNKEKNITTIILIINEMHK